jgi:hypothetical protein
MLHYAGTLLTEDELTNLYNDAEHAHQYLYKIPCAKWRHFQNKDLLIDPLQGGNTMSSRRINAKGLDGEDHVDYPQNVKFCTMRQHGWPFVFIVATTAIQKGVELLIDYGVSRQDEQYLSFFAPLSFVA